MKPPDYELELENERVTERRYAEKLVADEKAMPRPHSFTGTTVQKLPHAIVGRFVGRVALRNPDEDGARDFYIGERHTRVDGVEVYSWSAPIACSFYRRNHQHNAYRGLGDLCADAVVIRSFRHEGGKIAGFADDALAADAPSDPFEKRQLRLPTASRRPLPRPIPAGTGSKSRPDQGKGVEPNGQTTNPLSQQRKPHVDQNGSTEPEVRAERLLRDQLHAPRTNALGPVLSTLQGEQYELITVPAMDSMVIEGKPGTGKTIIASHRAAYLVSDQTPPENALDGKVLIVGPTPEYTRHIRDVIGRLADHRDRVLVLSMPELMRELIGAKNDPRGATSNVWQDIDWKLGQFCGSAIARHKSAHGTVPAVEVVYEYLRSNSVVGRPLTQEFDWMHYLRGLPPHKEALSLRAHWPLLAFIAWSAARPVRLTGIEHIIVDESQDVGGLEWFLLQSINEAHAWTILGDLNQRRSDHTYASWSQVLEVLAIDANTPVRELKRGYRSTRPILEYANKLLPKAQRSNNAFQHGGMVPSVIRVSPNELRTTIIKEVDRLVGEYPTGTVAVISVNPDQVRRALRGAGWAALTNDRLRWQRQGAQVTVTEPDSARGLEFDAVIVLEPHDFPTNYGRQGPLYTALTRGNRELSVIHSKSLPDELRRK